MARERSTSVRYDRKKHCFVGLNETIRSQLKTGYEGVNIDAELEKMKLWLESDKGKERIGNINFIMNWLNNARTYSATSESAPESPLQEFLDIYRKELWKNWEHVLLMNTMH